MLKHGLPTWRDRSGSPDSAAQSRWHSQPATVRPGRDNLSSGTTSDGAALERVIEVLGAATIPVLVGIRVRLVTGHSDMRKGFDGLALRIQEVLRQIRATGTRSYSVASAVVW